MLDAAASPGSLRLAAAALALLVAGGGCRELPTTVLLEIRASEALLADDVDQRFKLTISIFDEAGLIEDSNGQPVDEQPLPENAALAQLPDDVVLYPGDSSGELRLLVQALTGSTVVGQGMRRLAVTPHEQTEAVLLISSGRWADADADGVPDAIDNCPSWPNHSQSPCPAADSRSDGAADGNYDCDRDRDGYRSRSCGGDDCDDDDATVNPGGSEGPPGHASCRDNRDNDCSGAADQADPACAPCTDGKDCDDGDDCSSDFCSAGRCLHTPVKDGTPCPSNRCVVGGSCQAGVCQGPAVNCNSSDPCKLGQCDPKVGCRLVDRPDGTPCNIHSCTTGESCQRGECRQPAGDSWCYIPALGVEPCQPAGATDPDLDLCRCDPAEDPLDWTPPAGQGCSIDGVCYHAGDSPGAPAYCDVCDPARSTKSWSTKSGCVEEIVIAALNRGYDGDLGGRAGADDACALQAAAAGLAGEFRAFLSTNDLQALQLVQGANADRPVVNTQGNPLFSSWATISSAPEFLSSYVVYSFDGKQVALNQGAIPEWQGGQAWTGTDAGGAIADATCDDWTSAAAAKTGQTAEVAAPSRTLLQNDTGSCAETRAVLCVKVAE